LPKNNKLDVSKDNEKEPVSGLKEKAGDKDSKTQLNTNKNIEYELLLNKFVALAMEFV